MSSETQAVGEYGERVAARHLESLGMEVLATNWRCRWGEVDIVALDGASLVFCEVKTRRGGGFGSPVEAVTPLKAARLRRLAGAWVDAHPDLARRAPYLRIDVVGVLRPPRGKAVIDHLVGVA